jgi:hypothetical protein
MMDIRRIKTKKAGPLIIFYRRRNVGLAITFIGGGMSVLPEDDL